MQTETCCSRISTRYIQFRKLSFRFDDLFITQFTLRPGSIVHRKVFFCWVSRSAAKTWNSYVSTLTSHRRQRDDGEKWKRLFYFFIWISIFDNDFSMYRREKNEMAIFHLNCVWKYRSSNFDNFKLTQRAITTNAKHTSRVYRQLVRSFLACSVLAVESPKNPCKNTTGYWVELPFTAHTAEDLSPFRCVNIWQWEWVSGAGAMTMMINIIKGSS